MACPANPALKVWKAAMTKIHEDLELKDFPESDLVSYRYYCADTGLLATTNCGNKALGWFKNSYLPTCSHGGSLLDPVTKPTPVGGSNREQYLIQQFFLTGLVGIPAARGRGSLHPGFFRAGDHHAVISGVATAGFLSGVISGSGFE